MTYPLEKIILYEVDKPIDLAKLVNFESGLWYFKVIDIIDDITDDHDVTGYYQYQNDTKYNIKSLRVDNYFYTKVDNLTELRLTNQSFRL